MAWTRKHLLSIRELDASEITLLIDTAASLEEIAGREIKKVPAMRGKTVVNLFYEASTRTRTSFEIAGKRLSADVVNFSASGSSVGKGESFVDTAKNIAAMSPDVVVVRHSSAGAAHLLARELSCSIVNAGDGAHEHPTQALLDLLTIREKKGHLDGLHVAIVGDVAHSRVARSNIHGMRKLGMSVTVAGPPTLIPPHAQELGVKVVHRLEDAIRDADVIMMLRLQQERMTSGLIPSLREYSRDWGR
jgi:aspartate carbamoyltransferase catalytic subunit